MIDLNEAGEQRGTDRKPFDLGAFLSEAATFLQGFGLAVDATLDTSGKLTRCPTTDNPRGRDGAYAVHLDDPATVWCQNWKTGDTGTHCGVDQSAMTDSQRSVLQARIKANVEARDREAAERYATAAKEAQDRYLAASAEGVNAHPYAIKKRADLGPLVRRGKHGKQDCLVVPLFDEHGAMTSLQFIGPAEVFHGNTTDRTYLAGGLVGCHPLGNFRGASSVAIVEGLATGAAVHSTGLPVVCAMDAGHLLPVGQLVRKLAAPGAEILFMADDDQKPDTGKNPGIEAAERAAQAVGGRVVLPAMGRKADFWDVWHEQGPEGVKRCIEAARAAVASIWDRPADIAAMLVTQPEPMSWLIAQRIPFSRGGVLTALGGTGKTTLLKALAVGCITGRLPMDGWEVDRTGKVVLVLTEDTHAEFHEDLHQLCQGMTTRERELIASNLIVFPLAGKDTRLLVKSPRGVVERSALYSTLVAKIRAIGGVVLVGLDPALGISEGDELAQEDQRALGRAVDDLAVNCGATCVVLSHAAKGILSTDELNSHSSRGGGALTDALRFEITMRGMTAKEATKYGVEDLAERNALVQIAITKGNRISPAAKVPVWLRYDSGTLVSAGLVEPEKKAASDGSTKLNKGSRLVFDALRQAAMEYGLVVDGEFCGVDMDQWQRAHEGLFYAANPAHGPRAGGQAFGRGVAKLVEVGMVRVEGVTVFFDGPGSEIHTKNIMDAIDERRPRNTEQNSTKRNIVPQ